MPRQRKVKRPLIKRALLTVVVLAIAAVGLELGNVTNFVKDRKTGPAKESPLTETPASTIEENGGIIDTGGHTPGGSQNQEGITSKSGNITVIEPAPNSLIKNGAVVSGTSKKNSVSYRLIDDSIGVIATGSLEVIDGRFSGKFDFSSQGTKGRLDIFSTLGDGREVDVVEILVRYK